MDSRPNLFKAVTQAVQDWRNGASVEQMLPPEPPRPPVVPDEPEASSIQAYTAEPLTAWGAYIKQGVPDKTGVTFDSLRNFSYRMTPLNAILSTRVNQSTRFCQRYTSSRYGIVEEPSFRIRMRDRNAEPTDQDTQNMNAWYEFFEMGGWCPPPEEDRPAGWRAGLDYIIKPLVRDTFTIDYVPLKKFAQKGQEKQFPVVSMCLDDGALYRNAVGEKVLQSNGTYKIEPYEADRTTTRKQVHLVRLMGDGSYLPAGEFTSSEVSMFIRNIRSDERMRGYGFPEVEQGLDAVRQLLEIRTHNLDRFRKDRLPRGFFKLVGKVSPTARAMFENRMMQMLTNKEWTIPILQVDPPSGNGVQGTDLEWVDINQALKDGEYAQLAYSILTELHAVHHISLQETGMAEMSPFPGGLAEKSPEDDILNSQSHFSNLMVDIANFFTREVLWKSPGGKRYIFEWVGLGDRDYMLEEQLAGMMLQNGTINLRMLYKYRDIPLPRSIENSPAVDLPMNFAMALQYLDQKEAEAMQNEVMQKQQADQEAMQEAQARGARKSSGGSDRPSVVPTGASPGVMPLPMPQQGMDVPDQMPDNQAVNINIPKPQAPQVGG